MRKQAEGPEVKKTFQGSRGLTEQVAAAEAGAGEGCHPTFPLAVKRVLTGKYQGIE